GGREPALAVAARLRLFTNATSLGSTESLVEHRASIEGPDSPTPGGLLRLSVGLEHGGDLVADLAQALADCTTPRRTPARRGPAALPGTGVRHRRPGLGRRQGVALLQQLDRDQVRCADEGHAAVARRAVDGHAQRLQVGADRVDVIDLEGQVAEVAGAAVVLRRR